VAGRSLDILVVDNDPRIVEASIALLTRFGHRARGAADGAGALAQCATVDAVLADYQLDQGEDGLTLIEELRQLRPGLPAALITAEGNPAIRQRAAALGVEVFAKPVSPTMIEAFLARVSMTQVEP
jgi:CheY-like chemotaxis protein